MLNFIACREYEIVTGNKNTIITKCQDGKYEIKLDYNRKGEGFSLHNFSWDKYDLNETYWIYIDTLNGITKDSSVIISMFREKHGDYLSSDRNYRGTILVDTCCIKIDLKEPYFEEYRAWKLNGLYYYEYSEK